MKIKPQLITCLLIGAVSFTACNAPVEKETPAIDMEALKTEIQAMEDAFAAGEKAKDANAVAAYYADDAVSYGRDEMPKVGKAVIKKDIEDGLAADTSGSYNVYKVVDLYAAGDIAVEIGSWTKMDASGTQIATGHYMSYFEKRDGKYICVRDMNVSSAPPATAESATAAVVE